MFFATHVGNLFAGGRSSCEGYIEIFIVQRATSSRVDLPVAKNTQKIFQESCFQSVSWLSLATVWRLELVAKIACVAQIGQFLNVFSFPLNILTIHCLPHLNSLSNSPYYSRKTSIFASFHPQIFKEKVWAFSLSLHIS